MTKNNESHIDEEPDQSSKKGYTGYKWNEEVETLRAENMRLRAALRFYAWEDETRLPSEGPWGVNSTDFGKVARAALNPTE